MWGISEKGVLLRREPLVRDALDWASTWVQGASVSKVKTNVGGVYEVHKDSDPFGVVLAELRRVDPKGVIAAYPVASLPLWKIDEESANMAQVIRTRGHAELDFGTKAPVILALHSVGWTERSIAEALETSRTYVMKVVHNPKPYLIGVNS